MIGISREAYELHFFIGAVVAIATGRRWMIWVIALAIGKELADFLQHGKPDLFDIFFTGLGGIIRYMEKRHVIVILSVLACSFLAGLADGARDTLSFRYSQSIFPQGPGERLLGGGEQFWNPALSWRNKWKNGDPAQGERYPGSSTALVFLTDGWHLLQFIMLTFFQLAIALPVIMLLGLRWWWVLIAIVPLKFAFSIGFGLMFGRLLIRRGGT